MPAWWMNGTSESRWRRKTSSVASSFGATRSRKRLAWTERSPACESTSGVLVTRVGPQERERVSIGREAPEGPHAGRGERGAPPGTLRGAPHLAQAEVAAGRLQPPPHPGERPARVVGDDAGEPDAVAVLVGLGGGGRRAPGAESGGEAGGGERQGGQPARAPAAAARGVRRPRRQGSGGRGAPVGHSGDPGGPP